MPLGLFPAASGNYGSRQNTPVDLVVLHTTESAYHSAVCWFADSRAKASAHYVIAKTGALGQCVPEGFEAFHAGNSAVNRRSIGIELEGYAAQGWVPPPEQFDTLVHLLADVCARHGIPLDREHVIGHCEVADPAHPSEEWIHGGAHHHGDPGSAFPWDDLMARLHALGGVA